jgi:hypothetical protein
MPKDTPFDVWNGEDLNTVEVAEDVAAEEVAMHVEAERELGPDTWSELTDDSHVAEDEPPVVYFADEQPEVGDTVMAAEVAAVEAIDDDVQPDLEDLLERQHYAFPPGKD